MSLEKVDLIQLKELLHDGKNLLITLMTTESLHDHEHLLKC